MRSTLYCLARLTQLTIALQSKVCESFTILNTFKCSWMHHSACCHSPTPSLWPVFLKIMGNIDWFLHLSPWRDGISEGLASCYVLHFLLVCLLNGKKGLNGITGPARASAAASSEAFAASSSAAEADELMTGRIKGNKRRMRDSLHNNTYGSSIHISVLVM